MRKILLPFLVSGAVLFAGAAAADPTAIALKAEIPFTDPSVIEKAILTDCQLPETQAKFLLEAAQEFNVPLAPASAETPAGRRLEVEIVNAIAAGNAWIGHNKQVTLKGRLLEGDTVIGNFSAVRSSGGGAFAGFKGSCSVLHRCAKTLGQDIAKWLQAPSMDARLGELR